MDRVQQCMLFFNSTFLHIHVGKVQGNQVGNWFKKVWLVIDKIHIGLSLAFKTNINK